MSVSTASIKPAASLADHLREERDRLETKLAAILRAFEEQTGLRIESVEVARARNGYVVGVRTDVRL